jgi:hypothetical protein
MAVQPAAALRARTPDRAGPTLSWSVQPHSIHVKGFSAMQLSK